MEVIMATQKSIITGKDGYAKIGSESIVYLDQWSMDISQEVLEALKTGTRWAENAGGKKSATGSMNGTLNTTDSALTAMVTTFVGEDEVVAELHLGYSKDLEFRGNVVLTGFNVSYAVNSKATWSCNYTFDGAPAHGAPASPAA